MGKKVFGISEGVCPDIKKIDKTLEELKAQYDFDENQLAVIRHLILYGESTIEEIHICTGINSRIIKKILVG